MNLLNSFRFKSVIAIALLASSVPALAQKHRAVRHSPPPGAAVQYKVTGTVLDAVTNAPVVNATVTLGTASKRTNSQGKFSLTGEFFGTTMNISAARSGYLEGTQSVASGTHDITFRLQSTPTARMRLQDGTQRDIDFESIEFGYVPPFGSYIKDVKEDFCRPDGTQVTITKTEIARINGPAVLASQAACCSTRESHKINVTLKSGQTTDLYFTDSCVGYNIDFIGRDHVSGEVLFTHFTNIAEIVFP